jgi:hypothetical protein
MLPKGVGTIFRPLPQVFVKAKLLTQRLAGFHRFGLAALSLSDGGSR